MFATARHACVLAFAGAAIIGISSPAAASDRLNDKSLPPVSFTLASSAPFTPGVAAAVPTTLFAEVADEATAAVVAEPQTRPLDIAVPRLGGASLHTSLRRTMYVSFAALQVMDALSTRKALAGGATEANPAMAGIAGNSAALFAVKAGTAVATTFLVERIAKNHPRRATIVMAVLNTAYAAVVAHNYSVASRTR